MELLIKLLTVGGWTFLTIGTILMILGIWGQLWYSNSIDKIIDKSKGVRRDFTVTIKSGLKMIVISLIVLITIYTL